MLQVLSPGEGVSVADGIIMVHDEIQLRDYLAFVVGRVMAKVFTIQFKKNGTGRRSYIRWGLR